MREADPIHLRWVECNNEVGICGWSTAGADVAVGGVGGHGAEVGMGEGGEEGEEGERRRGVMAERIVKVGLIRHK